MLLKFLEDKWTVFACELCTCLSEYAYNISWVESFAADTYIAVALACANFLLFSISFFGSKTKENSHALNDSYTHMLQMIPPHIVVIQLTVTQC